MATVVASSRELDDFEGVVRLYWPKVFRFALASLRDSHAAETLAQDCFFRAYKARDTFRGEASVSTWLMQIAVNLIRDHARDRRWQFWRRARLTEPAPELEKANARFLFAIRRVLTPDQWKKLQEGTRPEGGPPQGRGGRGR